MARIDGPLSRAGLPLEPDPATRAVTDWQKANRDFQSLFLNEFLKPLTAAMEGSEDEGALFSSNGLDTYSVFANQAMAGELSGSWPLPNISAPPTAVASKPDPLEQAKRLIPLKSGSKALPLVTTASPIPKPPAIARPAVPSVASTRTEAVADAAGTSSSLPGVPPLPDSELERASRLFDLPVNLLRAVVLAESGGRSNAVSSAGAKGYMQLMPATAKEMGVNDPSDPWENIFAGAKYLSRQLTRFGRVDHALAAYNAGPGNVVRHDGIPPFRETQAYVKKVLAWKSKLDAADPASA